MRARLLVGFLAFAVAVAAVLEIPLGVTVAHNERNSALTTLQRDAGSLSVLVAVALTEHNPTKALAVARRYVAESGATVALLQNGHTVLAVGPNVAEAIGDPQTASIVVQAASSRISGEESGNDPDSDFLYAAVPIGSLGERAAASDTGAPGGSSTAVAAPGPGSVSSTGTPHVAPSPVAVLLVAESAGPVDARIASNWLKLALFGIGVILAAAVAGMLLARSLTRPLAGIEAAVERIGAGSLSERVPPERRPGELETLARTVNAMADRLEELLRAQRAFVADASHQLRAPMTALRLRLENLEAAQAASPARTASPASPGLSGPSDLSGLSAPSDLSAALAEADRLSRVVDGLLALARAEGTRPERQPVAIGEIVSERASAWRALAEERAVSLEDPTTTDHATDAPHDDRVRVPLGPFGLACPGHLEQVLDNLLANALDATPAGGTVTLRTLVLADTVEVHVIDSGPGMTPNERARAFDRFWRPEGSTAEGTGLGLAIVDQLIRVSGGEVELVAGKDSGIDAVVRLEAATPPRRTALGARPAREQSLTQ